MYPRFGRFYRAARAERVRAQRQERKEVIERGTVELMPQDERDRIAHELARQTTSHGTYRYTANAIARHVGGRRDRVLNIVRTIRGTPPRPEPGPRFEQTGPSSYRRVQGT
jgi:hypothetical protein